MRLWDVLGGVEAVAALRTEFPLDLGGSPNRSDRRHFLWANNWLVGTSAECAY